MNFLGNYLLSKKTEKTNDPFQRKLTDREATAILQDPP